MHRSNTSLVGSFGSLNSVLGAFGITVGAVGLAQLAKDILRTNIEMEQLRARLDAASSSLVSSKAAFAMILQIAKETPQSISEITKAYTMMKNFGLDPNEKAMRGFTDVTSKLGGASDTLTGIIRAFGQANGKAALHAQDANQMIERGVPVYGLLVKVLDKSTAEIMKMMEAGELGRDTMEKLRQELFKWADGSSAKMMDTLGGSIEGLSSSWKHLEDTLMGSKAESLLKNSVQFMGAYLDWLSVKMADSPIDQKITELQDRLVNPKKSFIGIGLQSLGVIDTPDSIQAQISALQKEKLNSEKALAADKKQIQDQADGERIQAEMATNKAIENGDTDALKKYMSAKLEAIKSTDKEIIRQQAELASIPAKLAMAIVSVESTGQMVVNKDSGAAGLMQVMPANYQNQGYTQAQMLSDASISVKAGLKVWQDSMDVAKKAVVQGTIDVGQIFDYAATLYTTKHQTISDRIKKNGGVFDINLFKEASDWAGKVKAGMSLQNVSKNDIFAPYKKSANEAAQVAKKAATEQEQVAKKAAEEHKRIINDAPVMKLQEGIAKLNEQSKAGVLGNETYQYQLSKLFDAYENAAFGAKEFSQEQEKIDRLMTAIATPSEKFMDSMIPYIDLLKQGKIETADFTKASLYFQAQMNKPEENLTKKYKKEGQTGYDNEIESLRKMQRELTSTEDEMYRFDLVNRKTSDGLHQLFSDNQIEQIMKMHDEVKSLKFIDDMGLSNRKLASSFSTMFSQVLTEGKSFSDSFRGMMHGMINSVSSKLMDSGMSSIMSGNFVVGGASMAAGIGVGLLSSLFKDKTVDYTHASSDTAGTSLGSSDPSNSLRGVISTLYDIHAQQFPVLKKMSEEFTLMAKGVDNTIALAIKQHGSFVASANGMSASSKSPNGSAAMVVGSLAASTAMGAAGIGTTIMAGVANAAISAGLSTVGGALGGAATAMASTVISTGMALGATASSAMLVGGAVLGLAGGLIIAGLQYGLGKLLGIGKTKFTAIGSGIIANINTAVIDGVASAQSTVYDYSTVKAVTKGWFSDTTKIYDVINGIDGGLSATFDSVFNHLYEGLGSVADALGKKEEFLAKATQMTPIAMGFNFTGKKGDEISTMLSESISTMSDKIANYFFGGIFGGLQRMGEGMLQTTIRVISQAQAVIYQFGRLSNSPVTTIENGMKNLDLAAVALSDSLIAQYESSTNANDGLKNFTASMNAFYDATTSAGKKVGDAIDTVNNSISEFKKAHPDDALMANATANSTNIGEILTHMADIQRTDAKNVGESSGYNRLVALGDSIKDAFSPSQPFDESALSTIGVNTWKPLAGGDLASATWHSGQLEKYKVTLENAAKAASTNLEFKGFDVWVAAINANTLAQNNALPIVNAAGITSKADADKQLATAKAQVDAANNITKSTTDLSSNVSVLNQNSETVNSLIQSILKPSIDATKQSEIMRGIESVSGSFAKTDDLTGRLADFDKAYNTHVLPSIQSWMKTTTEFKDKTNISTATLKAYSYVIDDVAKAVSKLTESTKYVKDLKTTIGDWVTNLQVTSLGSTKSQLDAAAKNFSAKMSVINNDFMTAEQKRTALSGITGNADQYIQAIKISPDRKVSSVDPEESRLDMQRIVEARLVEMDNDVIAAIKCAIINGDNIKTTISKYCKALAIGKRTVDDVLRRYANKFWKITPGLQNTHIYSLIE